MARALRSFARTMARSMRFTIPGLLGLHLFGLFPIGDATWRHGLGVFFLLVAGSQFVKVEVEDMRDG